MGWSCTHKRQGQPLAEFFINDGVLKWSGTPATFTVVATAYRMPAFYAAVERVEGDKREVFAVVILVQHRPKEDYNFCYKAMDESSGPNADSCPASVLMLLTTSVSEYANGWRARCWAKIEKAKIEKVKLASIKVGTRLRYGEETYVVTAILGLKGFQVNGMYRLSRSQACKSEILE